jgi:hypothetical protein
MEGSNLYTFVEEETEAQAIRRQHRERFGAALWIAALPVALLIAAAYQHFGSGPINHVLAITFCIVLFPAVFAIAYFSRHGL